MLETRLSSGFRVTCLNLTEHLSEHLLRRLNFVLFHKRCMITKYTIQLDIRTRILSFVLNIWIAWGLQIADICF